jgi:hypothetical protein
MGRWGCGSGAVRLSACTGSDAAECVVGLVLLKSLPQGGDAPAPRNVHWVDY